MTDLVSDLKIGAKIGNGHLGQVFVAEDPARGEAAVKVLSRHAHQDDTTLIRLASFPKLRIPQKRRIETLCGCIIALTLPMGGVTLVSDLNPISWRILASRSIKRISL